MSTPARDAARKDASASPVSGSRALAAVIASLAALLLWACTPTRDQASDARLPPRERELTVMTFNVEYGGEEVNFESVIRTIEKSNADVVGLEEAWGNTARIARALGWDHYDNRTQTISRLPLLAPADADGLHTFVEVDPGRVVAIGNVHLPASPYGPFRLRDGVTPKAVVAMEERVRLTAARPFIHALSRLARDGIPVFLVGDFNAPSKLDWTEAAVGSRDHVEHAVEWPVSAALENAGFEDSYREVHPDPVEHPGLTWPAARPFVPGYNPARNDAPADRIDLVYSSGPARAIDSALVGERGGPGVDIAIAPWPTDHRAVVSTFEVTPGVPPTMVSVDRRLADIGDTVDVRFHSPGGAGERITVVPAGSDPGASALFAEQTPGESSTSGVFRVSTRGWESAAYDAVLVSESGTELARTPFWVKDPDAGPRLATSRSVYQEGDPIEVEWELAPGHRWDWVGIYRRGADPNVASYMMWLYTDATIAGSAVLDVGANGPWPLQPGRYSAYLLEDDSYEKLAAAPFTVK
jgi:endonuclease/exonuclease/phosphatase family metal-dependent hydrolase